MSELKACPFCGGTAIDVGLEAYRPVGGTPDDRWRVRCKSCWSPGAWGDSSDEAITHWNTRTPDPLAPLVQAVVDAAKAWYEVWLTIGVAKPIREGHNGRPLSDLIEAVHKLRETQG